MRRTALGIAALGIAVFGLTLMGSIHRGAAGDTTPGGDAQAGKAAAAACTECHGAKGIGSIEGVPNLAGQHAAYLAAALKAYKSGDRQDESMIDIVAKLSDTDVVNLAAYFASLPPFAQAKILAKDAAAVPVDEADPFAAVKEATADCALCHGDDGNTDTPGMPGLAGQHAPYLILTLQAYRDATRGDETMQALVADLSESDFEDMAYYYAAMTPRRAETPAVGDAVAGLAVTAQCVNCHGEDGNNKDPKTPRLSGLDAEYLATTIAAYKDGSRAHDVMRDAVLAMRQSDVQDMAAYYAGQEPKALSIRKPLTTAEWVERCDRCHGQGGAGDDPRFPILAGQAGPYLAKTLKLYHAGDRANSMMQAMSFPMGKSDIQKLAAYYARQRTP